ncbi:MAG: class I SAM-dependent methyltransferase [Bdellovibrionales bacterium]|nr:class I SAM-dependent methyltransferase [Bdellovibrionales bacterium]
MLGQLAQKLKSFGGPPPVLTNDDTFVRQSRLGKVIPPFRKTFDYPGEYINQQHEYYSSCPVYRAQIQLDIEGSLRPEDALKLYEMSYFAKGDVLELGTSFGLSTSILSQANRDSGWRKKIESVDLDPSCVEQAQRNLAERGLSKNVNISVSDAGSFCQQMVNSRRAFSFAFIDHAHSYGAMHPVCVLLNSLIMRGGFCLFHDYNDKRNNNSDDTDYDVVRAVQDGLGSSYFEFYGMFGCTGLFRKKP